MTTLLLIRHGDFEDGDGGLSAVGLHRVRQLARRLEPASAVIASPTRRTSETAAIIAEKFRLPVVTDDRWTEADFGDPDVTPAVAVSLEGQTIQSVTDRVTAAVHDLVAARPGQTVVVVTHADVIAVAVAAVLTMPAGAVFRLQPDTATVTAVRVGDRPRLLRFNAPA